MSYKLLGEISFHQIYNFGAIWDKNELIGQQIKSQSEDENIYGPQPTLGSFCHHRR